MNILFRQAAGLGDLLFLEPIARHLFLRGNKIFWPVVDQYKDIARYIPYINWCEPKNAIEYERVYEFDSIKPQEYGCRILAAKYKYADLPLDMWRTFHFNRDLRNEFFLAKQLKIDFDEPYRLIHTEYDTNRTYSVEIAENPDMRNIYVKPIRGFSLFDWSAIIENAKEIHAVSTSTLWFFEKLELLHNPEINLYARHNDQDFAEVKLVLSKNYRLIGYSGKVENI